MEKKFYTNDFEQLLKENADQFKLAPSKKVWHGIYNDIHPGRRWPSIAMSLLFVFTLIFVGHLNIEPNKKANLSTVAKINDLQKNTNPVLTGNVSNLPSQNNSSLNSKRNISGDKIKEKASLINNTGLPQSAILSSAEITNDLQKSSLEKIAVSTTDTESLLINNQIAPQKEINFTGSKNVNTTFTEELTPARGITVIDRLPVKISNTSAALASGTYNLSPGIEKKSLTVILGTTNENISTSKKTTNKATSVLPFKFRRNAKISWAYYLSPGFSYRIHSKQGNMQDQMAYSNVYSNVSLSNAVTHQMSPSIEAGTAMKYSVTKKINLTAGLQANYSAYTIQANNIHPIMATLVLMNQKTGISYPSSSISYFGNGSGSVPVKLHNYSVQLSLPVGLEYQLAGNDNIQFFAAGSIQPSLVLATKAYMISTDKRNYLTNPSLSRAWNMGTNLGAFVSLNSNKFKWQIGPQVRYQLFSSYRNEYQIREHYIDYSIRLAISKTGK